MVGPGGKHYSNDRREHAGTESNVVPIEDSTRESLHFIHVGVTLELKEYTAEE